MSRVKQYFMHHFHLNSESKHVHNNYWAWFTVYHWKQFITIYHWYTHMHVLSLYFFHWENLRCWWIIYQHTNFLVLTIFLQQASYIILPESVSDSDMLKWNAGSSSSDKSYIVARDLPWRGENKYSLLMSSSNPYSWATFLFLSFSFWDENSPFPPEPETKAK